MIPLLFVLILLLQHYTAEGYDCSHANINYDKIVGVRPKDTTKFQIVFKSTTPSPITKECFRRCSADKTCTNFIIFYNDSICYEFKTLNNKLPVYTDEAFATDYVEDPNVAFFVKTCLTVPEDCKMKLWPVERVPGSTLVSMDSKQVPGLHTRQECAQFCINANQTCRSANFKMESSDNSYLNVSKILGFCWLNDVDRHTLPNSYRASNYGDEYIENQCNNISTAVDYCAYEEYINSTLKHVDDEYVNVTKNECQELCEQENMFNCHGFSLIPIISNIYQDDKTKYHCLIHSEDSQLLGPKMIGRQSYAKYFERTRCLNLSVSCSNVIMEIKYTPETKFRGRIYMHGYSESNECNANGKGIQPITLQIGLEKRQCGLIEAKSNEKNRNLLAGYLIIQYNPLIQTQGDRLVRVGCVLDDSLNDYTENVTLGAQVKFNSSLPGPGIVIINNSTVHPIVKISVVDPFTNLETNDVQIGQKLQFRIEIEPADGPYDIWAGHLVAKTENDRESILLLDDRGCPVNTYIFPALRKTQTPTKRLLYANFDAFKFATSPVVRFSVIVHFCTLNCPPIICTNSEVSYGRKRRAAQNDVRILNSSTNSTDDIEINAIVMPLEYIIRVRNDNAYTDRLVIGDGKILVAGYDVFRNQVCLDYSVVIGILVVWLIIQVIIFVGCIMIVRRYRKYYDIAYDRQSLSDIHNNFGLGCSNLNRRVHWADQNCPACPHAIIDD